MVWLLVTVSLVSCLVGLALGLSALPRVRRPVSGQGSDTRGVADPAGLGPWLARLMEANVIGIMVGRALEVLDANDVFLAMVGRSRADLDAAPLDLVDMTPPEHRTLDVHALGELRRWGATTPYEKELFRKDGTRVPVLVGSARIAADEGRWVAFVVDLSARNLAIDALAASETRYRLAARAARDVIWDWNVLTGEVACNEALARFGYRPEAFGRTIDAVRAWWAPRVHPDDRPHVVGALDAAVAAGHDTWRVEYRFRRADGFYAYVIDRAYIARDDAGRPVRVVGSLADITARKRAEAEREAFLARAAHELRTPLTSAVAVVRLLPRALAGQLRESPEDMLEVANRNLAATLALIDDLLDAAKLNADQEPLVREPVLVADLVARSVEAVGPEAREKGLDLRVDVRDGLAVEGDPLKLEQLLVNLLANAVVHTPASGTVTIEAERSPHEVQVRVRDTGAGIPPEHLERIFEPFFQAHRRPRRQRGTGLGLSICRQIVTLHGGSIVAESEGPDRGSVFTVRLPVRAAAERAA